MRPGNYETIQVLQSAMVSLNSVYFERSRKFYKSNKYGISLENVRDVFTPEFSSFNLQYILVKKVLQSYG